MDSSGDSLMRGRAAWLAALVVLVTPVVLIAAVALPNTAAALPDTAVAPPDTALSAAEDVILDFTSLGDSLLVVDVDGVLRAGQGVFLAFEDTIPFAEGTLDTLLVAAPRVKVSEVVRWIGERLEADGARMKEHSFTGTVKVIALEKDEAGGERPMAIYETVERYRLSGDGTYQYATLWSRERKFEGEELDKEEIEDEVEADWGELGARMIRSTPFSLHTGDAYNYAILDRRLLGLNVVYKMRFEPKSRFQALPSGTVWVDYGDFVVRRVEAEMIESVPFPLFVKAIPVYKLRRIQKGDFWVVYDVYTRIDLRPWPLLNMPHAIEVYYRTSRHEIGGLEYPDAEPDQLPGAVPAGAPSGPGAGGGGR